MRTPRIPAAVPILALAVLSACGADIRSEQAPTAPPVTAASASPPAAAQAAKGTTTCDAPGVGGYDLLSYTVDKTGKTIVFTATFAPIAPQHDVVVKFSAADSPKHVVGELFEDGSGVAQVQDAATLDTEYLDGPQQFAADHISLDVPRQSVDNRLIHGAVAVELRVDGATVETCSPGTS